MRKIQLLTVVLLIYGISANARDRIFCHTYPSNVLPAHVVDPELWTTLCSGKQDYYHACDHRIEFETGLEKIFKHSFTLITRKKIPEKN